MKINCITFDKQAKDSLPEDIKRQMKADRDKAREGKSNDIKIMATEGKETMTLGWAEEMAKKTDYACFAKEEPGNEINWADAGAFFLEGYREAFRWRDASQELPEQYKEVLLKSGDFRYVGYRIIEEHEGFYYWADLNDDEITDVTHWRPIEMEDL